MKKAKKKETAEITYQASFYSDDEGISDDMYPVPIPRIEHATTVAGAKRFAAAHARKVGASEIVILTLYDGQFRSGDTVWRWVAAWFGGDEKWYEDYL